MKSHHLPLIQYKLEKGNKLQKHDGLKLQEIDDTLNTFKIFNTISYYMAI